MTLSIFFPPYIVDIVDPVYLRGEEWEELFFINIVVSF